MTNARLDFSEQQIAELFGHEAAEDESPERLRQYYFRSDTFSQVASPLPLRVLVGHKGIGKSALFQIAMAEEREQGNFAIDLRPNEIRNAGQEGRDFLSRIEDWKVGLRIAILDASLRSIGSESTEGHRKTIQSGGSLVASLVDVLKPLLEKNVDTSQIKRLGLEQLVRHRQITVYVDDLDRGWKGRPGDIERLSAMLSAVRDLSRDNPGLRFRISLRSDVFFLVRTSDESTDKIESSVIWYSWTNHEILAMLVKRIETYFGHKTDESRLRTLRQTELAESLNKIMDDRFEGEGKWSNAPMYRVLMSLIRRRPRDLIKLLTLSARQAAASKSGIITTHNFKSIFERYSQDRIQDTVNEYRSELPSVERLILSMKPNRRERQARLGFLYTTDELVKKIRDLEGQGAFVDALGRRLSPRQVGSFLYKINFLIASKDMPDGYIDRKYFEENRYLSNELVDFGYAWEIHPAYRWALQPDSIQDIFKQVGLSA